MKTLLLAIAMLVGAGAAHAEEVLFTGTDCNTIGQDGSTFVLYSDQMHDAEYIPAAEVTPVGECVIKYHGVMYYEKLTDALIQKCG